MLVMPVLVLAGCGDDDEGGGEQAGGGGGGEGTQEVEVLLSFP